MSATDAADSDVHGDDPLRSFRAAQHNEPQPKFMSGEHIWLAQAGCDAACKETGESRSPYRRLTRRAGDERFSYGELVALSGDFYRCPRDLFEERPSPLPWLYEGNDLSDLRSIFATELAWIEDEKRAEGVGYPDAAVRLAWNAKSYIELALDNTDHFGWHNLVAYCRWHEKALQLAVDAAPDDADDMTWRRAVFTNAFADHFLTDAFAAGHIRVPRAEIREWGAGMGYSTELAGALSKLLHDQDGHIETLHHLGEINPAEDGLPVTNACGVQWHTRCDGQLFLVPRVAGPLLREPIAAVRESVKELLNARKHDVLPGDVFAATKHAPFPRPDTPGLIEKFPADVSDDRLRELLASVDWYIKVPWIGTGIAVEEMKALFAALPELMRRFRENVVAAYGSSPTLRTRLPVAYVGAFSTLK